MAPPLVKGRALARRRAAGIVFLVVIALMVELAIALYQKKFTATTDVLLTTNHAGNQLSVHADVKIRGLVVGEVRKIRSTGDGATLELALMPSEASKIPTNVTAQLLPKTLFGEKEVALILPSSPVSEHLRQGSTIGQDTSSVAIETERALDDALPLIQALQPQKVSMTLNALSGALRGRGNKLGASLALNAEYFKKINPALPTLAQDMAVLATVTNNYSDATPDLLRTLDNLSASSRNVVQERAALDTFLRSTTDFANTTNTVVAENERRLVDLARLSRPTAELFAHYSGNFACLLNRIAFSEIEGDRTLQQGRGLHITLEVIKDQGGFVVGDEPKNKETRTFGCFGLGPKPIIPYPAFANPQDGYRDGAPADNPGQGPGGCCTAAAWWGPVVLEPSGVVHRSSMPGSTTAFEALMVGPVAGFG